jgi:hypothetical protein
VSTAGWVLQFAALVLKVTILTPAIRRARRVVLAPMDKVRSKIPIIAQDARVASSNLPAA